ncbi:MAG: methylated-DNA--[protein]-cysteine S-methyltransferase [Gammaproteobacteria bacterium]|jgi:AraC family transcriptional regulator of adaptative response/methylated-DNA-[protein]-cysteine methyltransferase
MSDYDRIAGAIDYIVAHAGSQPGLADIAASADLSPYHFQRLFARWAGVTPKRFLQVITVERAKELLLDSRLPLLGASESLGLSSSSRLHDHFVRLEAVTPGEFRSGGTGLTIRHGEAPSPFGRVFVASTARGICSLAFVDEAPEGTALGDVASGWPNARLVRDDAAAGSIVERVFSRSGDQDGPLSIHVAGTNFQVSVWRALLAIPAGRLASYKDVARAIGKPRAMRAVGAAVGANPCAFLIPCHRVIRSNGEVGGYRWGLTRKQAIHAWEAAASDGILPEC